MKTVGDLLKNARLAKNITLEQIAFHTKINKKYLSAIEANEFSQLPPAAFAKGFLHTYAVLVDIDPKTVLAIFRRDYDQDDRGRIIPRSLTQPIRPMVPGITPNILTLVISLGIGALIIGFFMRQIIQFSAPPKLNVIEPTENSVLISPVTIRGVTDIEANVTINNRPVTINSNGEFNLESPLTEGQHTLVVVAVSRSGKKTTVERIVYVQSTPNP
jgi:cytoskeletal protein RodZ